MKSIEAKSQHSSEKDELDLDFRQYWLAVKRQWIPATSVGAIFLILTLLTLASQKPAYIAQGKLLIRPDKTPRLTGLESSQTNDLVPLSLQSNPLKTEIEVVLSKSLLEETARLVGLKDEQGVPKSADAVRSALDVEVTPGTDILDIQYSAQNPEQAAAVVNTLLNVYIKNNVQLNQAEAIAAREFISKELPKAEMDVSKAELDLSRFKEKNQLVAIDAEAEAAVGLVSKLDERIADFQSQLANANAQLIGLRRQVNMSVEEAEAVSAISQSEGVREVLTELQKLESKLASDRTFFQDNSPQIVDLRSREAALRGVLRQRVNQIIGTSSFTPDTDLQIGQLEQDLIEKFVNLEIQQLGLANQVNSLTSTRVAYLTRMSSLPGLERAQRDLERRVEVVQVTYTTLLTKLQEVKAAENQVLGNARVVETASIPKEPALSKKIGILATGGIILSLLAFGAMILVLESRDPALKSVNEVKKLLGYDVLEVIPLHSNDKKTSLKQGTFSKLIPEILVRDDPNSMISEIYRMLHVNLQSLEPNLESDRVPFIVIVSSPVSGEGTSVLAANLAAAASELERKVILIDANMRHPSQHILWNLPNDIGLANVLKGDLEAHSAIKIVDLYLSILTSGFEASTSVTLTKSSRMRQLLGDISTKFDFIVIDAPPILLASDASILGGIANGILMVTRLGSIDRSTALAAKESLQRSNQNVLGLVINNAKREDKPLFQQKFIENYYSNLGKE